MKLIALVLSLVAFAAHATPGGLNSSGCHNSKTAGYHCHTPRSSPTPSHRVSSSSDNERDPSVRREFHRNNPCPSTGKTSGACPGYHVDHITPLACGGVDATWNMQWLPAEENLRKGSMGCARR